MTPSPEIAAALPAVSTVTGRRYARLRVVHAPDSLASRIAFAPADADRYALAMRVVNDRVVIEDVAGAIDDARPHPSPGTVDVRWNLTFADASGAAHRLVSIDRFGQRALIDGVAATLHGAALIAQLKAMLR